MLNACECRKNGSGINYKVDYIKYVGSHVPADGGCKIDVVRRINKEYPRCTPWEYQAYGECSEC